MFGKLVSILLFLILVGSVVVFHKPITAFCETYLAKRDGEQAVLDGRLTEAYTIYEQASAKYPSDYSLKLRLAELYTEAGMYRNAKLIYEKILSNLNLQADSQNNKWVPPEHVTARVRLAEVIRLETPERTPTVGALNRAVNLLKPIVKQEKENPDVFSVLGHLYHQAANNPMENRNPIKEWLMNWAVYYYRQSVSLKPDDYAVRFLLGDTYRLMGNNDKAAREFCNAVMLRPDAYRARYNFGIVLMDLNYGNEAMRQLYKSVDLIADQFSAEKAKPLAEEINRIKDRRARFSYNNVFGEKDLPYPQDCLLGEAQSTETSE
jgi:predicted Zn-dependent protease